LEERAWLASLKNVELRSTKRVEKSRIFRGIAAADIKQEAHQAVKQGEGELQIREGWYSLYSKILERQMNEKQREDMSDEIDQVTILSVNWSKLFINECLTAANTPTIPSTPTSFGGISLWNTPMQKSSKFTQMNFKGYTIRKVLQAC